MRLKYEVGAACLWAQHCETEQENATLEISLKLQNETPIPPQKYKEGSVERGLSIAGFEVTLWGCHMRRT